MYTSTFKIQVRRNSRERRRSAVEITTCSTEYKRITSLSCSCSAVVTALEANNRGRGSEGGVSERSRSWVRSRLSGEGRSLRKRSRLNDNGVSEIGIFASEREGDGVSNGCSECISISGSGCVPNWWVVGSNDVGQLHEEVDLKMSRHDMS